jgi:hypothetical protein
LGRLFAFGGTPGALLQSTPKAWDLRVAPWRMFVLKEGFALSEAFLEFEEPCCPKFAISDSLSPDF